MAKNLRQVELTPAIIDQVRARAENCFLCKWIASDFHLHGKLTGWPMDYNDKPEFPVEGKIGHLELEGFIPRLDASPERC